MPDYKIVIEYQGEWHFNDFKGNLKIQQKREYCIKNNYPICPGIMTPTELEMALEFGLDVVKFFPAENAGGLKGVTTVGSQAVTVIVNISSLQILAV